MRPVTSSRRWPSFSRCVATIYVLSQQRHLPLAHRRGWRGDQCPRVSSISPCLPCLRWQLLRARRRHSPYGIGRSATPAEIAGWNIDIDRDGNNLPPGSGSVSHGREVFDQQCSACHGTKGEGGLGDKLVGGQGTLASPKPVRPSAVIGRTPRHYSTISAAPCRRTRRNRSATRMSMRSPPTSSI